VSHEIPKSTEPQNPGSLIQFAEGMGMTTDSPAARIAYSEALAQYRVQLAEVRGLTPDELHEAPLRSLGSTMLESQSSEQAAA